MRAKIIPPSPPAFPPPSFYAVSTDDRTINPELQRYMAARMGAQTVELKSSHVSLISHPQEIAALILKASGR
jgi:pimeloyl-ACP methyl ester carboxylesterase